MCGRLNPLGKPVRCSCRVKVEVQRPVFHEGVMEDSLHVTFKPLDRHVVQVTGQPLLMMTVRVNQVKLPVDAVAAVACRHVVSVCGVCTWQLHACPQAGHSRRGPWKTSQGDHVTAIQVSRCWSTPAMYDLWIYMRNWVSLQRIHHFYSIMNPNVALAAVRWH